MTTYEIVCEALARIGYTEAQIERIVDAEKCDAEDEAARADAEAEKMLDAMMEPIFDRLDAMRAEERGL
jgi:Holliday junction resolvasome RuvABC DNA-binding subunit